jgi:hypothetical protein
MRLRNSDHNLTIRSRYISQARNSNISNPEPIKLAQATKLLTYIKEVMGWNHAWDMYYPNGEYLWTPQSV